MYCEHAQKPTDELDGPVRVQPWSRQHVGALHFNWCELSTSALIDCLKLNECLWRVKCESYKNKNIRYYKYITVTMLFILMY